MLKKIRLATRLFCFSLFLATQSWAVNYPLSSFMTMDFEFPPNIEQTFSNAWWWTITATCTMHTKDDEDDLFAEVVTKKVKINEKMLYEKETMTIPTRSGYKLIISAESGAKVNLVNHGQNTLIAHCST